MSGSIRSKKRHYNRKHKLEEAGLRIRQWKESGGREIRYIRKKK